MKKGYKRKEKMMLIAFTIKFGKDKLTNDRKDCNVATSGYCLRINTRNTARRNSNGSCT